MGQGTSTLAVTVIENIEHQCDNEGCDLTFALLGKLREMGLKAQLYCGCDGGEQFAGSNIFIFRSSLSHVTMQTPHC